MAAGIDPVKYPNLSAERERDRQEHVKRAREMGATRKQASRHADEEPSARKSRVTGRRGVRNPQEPASAGKETAPGHPQPFVPAPGWLRVVGAPQLEVVEPAHLRVPLADAVDLQERLTVAIDRVGGRVVACGASHWVGEAGPRVRSRNPFRVLVRDAGVPEVHVVVTWFSHADGSWADVTLAPDAAEARPEVAAAYLGRVRDAVLSALA